MDCEREERTNEADNNWWQLSGLVLVLLLLFARTPINYLPLRYLGRMVLWWLSYASVVSILPLFCLMWNPRPVVDPNSFHCCLSGLASVSVDAVVLCESLVWRMISI